MSSTAVSSTAVSLTRREALVVTTTTVATRVLRPPAADASPAPDGVTRVVLRTASITPDAAADYLVDAIGLVKLDASQDAAVAKGRAVVQGAYGITLELRGGGDEGDENEDTRESLNPPALASLILGSDNPARARNRALRAGAAAPASGSPAAGERCSGDAFLGCAATLVGFPVVFVKTTACKGAPAVVRVGFSASSAAEVLDALGGEERSGLAEVTAVGGQQPGTVERAAEDRPLQRTGVLLAPAGGGGGGAVEVLGAGGGGGGGSVAWRVLSVAGHGGTYVPP